jgi:hypothetical protein
MSDTGFPVLYNRYFALFLAAAVPKRCRSAATERMLLCGVDDAMPFLSSPVRRDTHRHCL